MKFLWLSWKDAGHPQAGGAEKVLATLCKQLVEDGHEVTILTAAYPGAAARERVDGVEYIRVGSNRYLHSVQALMYYIQHLRNAFDVVIEVVNTAPYLSVLFPDRAKRLLFYHQLARDVWYHEVPRWLAHLGYFVLEPVATKILAGSHTLTLTISESTKQDLQRFGFAAQRIHVITQPNELATAPRPALSKEPLVLSLGAMRSMKRTLDQIAAFEIAKKDMPQLQLAVAGTAEGAYGARVLQAIEQSPYKSDIHYYGPVDVATKKDLMHRASLILVTSVKEGWGLIVTEAASQGTPAVVYDVDGLRDSVLHNKTGVVTAPQPAALARAIVDVLRSTDLYRELSVNAWQYSQRFTPAACYQDFMKVVGNL